jgi:hypothetical protein
MHSLVDQLRLIGGGVLCGAAFMVIALFVSGALHP